jgi:hypothetical protein
MVEEVNNSSQSWERQTDGKREACIVVTTGLLPQDQENTWVLPSGAKAGLRPQPLHTLAPGSDLHSLCTSSVCITQTHKHVMRKCTCDINVSFNQVHSVERLTARGCSSPCFIVLPL